MQSDHGCDRDQHRACERVGEGNLTPGMAGAEKASSRSGVYMESSGSSELCKQRWGKAGVSIPMEA